jgi:hypothetical protein
VNSLEARLYQLEIIVRSVQDQLRQLTQRLGAVEQQQFAGANAGNMGGGGGGSILFCQPTAAIAAATGIATPGGPLTGQTVWSINGGSFVSVSTTASIYNPMDDATVPTNNLAVSLNADGTYSAVSQSC